jgi:hypothetical protein
MGAAIRALRDTAVLLRHNPIVLGIGWLAFAALAVIRTVFGLIPLLGTVVSVFVFPAVAGGVIALVYAGRDGTAGVADFGSGVADNYLRLLAGYVLAGLPIFVVVFVAAFAFVFVVGMGTGLESRSANAAAGALVWVLLVVGVGLLLGLFWTAVQFFDVAIVAADDGVVESFSTSLSLFLEAPLSVIGFTLLRAAMGVVVLGGGAAVLWAVGAVGAGTVAEGDPGAALAGFVVALIVYGLVIAPVWRVLSRTYHVAYFNRRQAAG